MAFIAMCQRVFRSQTVLIAGAVVWTILCIQMFDFTVSRSKYAVVRGLSKNQESNNVSSLLHHTNLSIPKATPPAPTLRPFIPERPVQALILAYQRTGSSFFGHIFGMNPDAFYFYEPLDGAIMSLYGTAPGWAVPTEISHDWQGKLRDVPKDEQRVMSETLMGLYTCQFDAVATEVMGHNFMAGFNSEQPHIDGYSKCIKPTTTKVCSIKNVCPRRVGLSPGQQGKCADLLAKKRTPRKPLNWFVESPQKAPTRQLLSINDKQHGNVTSVVHTNLRKPVTGKSVVRPAPPKRAIPKRPPVKARTPMKGRTLPETKLEDIKYFSLDVPGGLEKMDNYVKCLQNVQTHVDSCLKHIDKRCRERHLHAVKTVRLDMASVEILLEHLPNLRVIHLLRDPRGVALSRNNLEWSAGAGAKKDIIQAAAMFCQVAAKDIKKRKELEKRFPGAFIQVIYEDFIEKPLDFSREMYKFLNMTLPDITEKYFRLQTHQKSGTKWQDRLTFHQAYDIHVACRELFDLVDDPRWLTM